jgi:hypothetical protein
MSISDFGGLYPYVSLIIELTKDLIAARNNSQIIVFII